MGVFLYYVVSASIGAGAKRGNAPRQGGLRHAELGGGAAETVGLGDFDE